MVDSVLSGIQFHQSGTVFNIQCMPTTVCTGPFLSRGRPGNEANLSRDSHVISSSTHTVPWWRPGEVKRCGGFGTSVQDFWAGNSGILWHFHSECSIICHFSHSQEHTGTPSLKAHRHTPCTLSLSNTLTLSSVDKVVTMSSTMSSLFIKMWSQEYMLFLNSLKGKLCRLHNWRVKKWIMEDIL